MSSLTSWMRLEPSPTSGDIEEGLAALIQDPLWMLTRQWQLREFAGEDSASPVGLSLRGQSARIGRYARGAPNGARGQAYDGERIPLETAVEREDVLADTASLRLRAEGGQQLLRLLDVQGVGRHRAAFRDTYPLSAPAGQALHALDAASRRYAAVMAGRVPDGRKLYAALRPALRPRDGTPRLPDEPQIPSADRAAVRTAALAWLDWYDARFSEPVGGSAWDAERMEYRFSVAARLGDDQLVLTADEYTDGTLDWPAFALAPGGKVGATSSLPAAEPIARQVIPVPVTYPGMPASRWWEFEDARVSFGAVEVGTRDLGRLLLIEFALVYGNDFFVVPVDLDVGSLCRIDSLVVTDSFGERTLIEPTSSRGSGPDRWRMFALSERAGSRSAGLLFLPPVLGPSLEGAPVEEVLLLRDEMANVAWAVERLVESPSGRPLDRLEEESRRRGAEGSDGTSPAPGAATRYRLATRVPESWIPLLPAKETPESEVATRLRRGRMLEDGQVAPAPRGRILEPDAALVLYDEEVPRAGARIVRAYQYARWIDGSTHLWVGRRKASGRGEGASGLRFDAVEEPRA